MAALTESGSKVTEFAGDYKVFGCKLDGTTATDGTLTVEEMDEIVSVQATLAEQSTAACAGVSVKSVSGNVITFTVNAAAGTICTQTPLDFYVTVLGRKTS